MLVMGIDSSSDIGAIGLIDNSGLLGEINIRLSHRHSERLLPNIDFLLKETGHHINELDGLAVTIGPGSFTGLRIGLSTVKAFAQVLDIPVIGLSSLDVLAYNIFNKNGWLVPVIDARRNRVYTSLYKGWKKDIIDAKGWPDQALNVDDLIVRLQNLDDNNKIYMVGNGINAYHDILIKSGLDIHFAPDFTNIQRGGTVAELGKNYLVKGLQDDIYNILPNYLKKPQAEINWQKKYGRG